MEQKKELEKEMKIDLYVTVYNDSDIFPFFINYYFPLVDRITFIENGSTDGTVELIMACAKKNGPVIRIYKTGMTWWDWDAGLRIRNEIWKDSDYDWIFFIDIDEIIFKPRLREFLKNTDCDIMKLKGYQMVSDKFPARGTKITDIKNGILFPMEDKYAIYRNTADIHCINAHSIFPTKSKICEGEIKLLHYKYLGVDIMVKRAKMIKERVPADSYTRGIRGNILKIYPGFCKTASQYSNEISQMLKNAKKVI
jgi:glycosyltransferase involved in cell wall biosynthesis